MQVTLQIDSGSEPLSGRLVIDGGVEIAFVGLLQLLPLLDRLRSGESLREADLGPSGPITDAKQ